MIIVLIGLLAFLAAFFLFHKHHDDQSREKEREFLRNRIEEFVDRNGGFKVFTYTLADDLDDIKSFNRISLTIDLQEIQHHRSFVMDYLKDNCIMHTGIVFKSAQAEPSSLEKPRYIGLLEASDWMEMLDEVN